MNIYFNIALKLPKMKSFACGSAAGTVSHSYMEAVYRKPLTQTLWSNTFFKALANLFFQKQKCFVGGPMDALNTLQSGDSFP